MNPASFVRHPLTMLLAAAVIAGISFWGAARYLEGRATAAERRATAAWELRPVIVARENLPAAAVLARERLAIRRVPAKFVPGGAAGPAQLAEVEGRQLLHALPAGQAITAAMLAGATAPLFSASIPAGTRALTFPVDEVNSFSGLLAPGDLIDLLYAYGAGTTETTVRPLLQAVRVRATGRVVRRIPMPSDDGTSGEVEREFTTITLDLSPEDAQRIVLAQRTGELTAVLRNPADGRQQSLRPLDSRGLFPSITTAVAPFSRGAPSRGIEIILGSGTKFIARPEDR